jgi:cytosine/adenosine deaminase-related metal-dependent hydrolase
MNTPYLILPEWLVVSAQQPPRRGWGLRIAGGVVAGLAPHAELRRHHPADQVWEAPGQVLAPGFVDAHTHLYGVLAHGIPLSQAPAGFWPFLEDFWWPRVENRLDVEMICAATDYQCASLLRSGVTSFYDCTEAPNALPGVLAAQAQVVQRHGLRGVLSFEATQRLSDANGRLGLEENAAWIQASRARRLGGMMCIHTSFTCAPDFIRAAFELAARLGALTHLHLSEGTYEPEYCLKRYGVRPVVFYDRLGVLGPGLLASQCVQLSSTEITLLAQRGARVTHMPLSNCEVGGGIAPIPELAAAGVTIGLGSDGYITDFFEVMRGAFLIHKAARCDPQVMPAALVWRMATEDGARAIGLEAVGRLEAGWQADFQLIEPRLPTPLEEHNLYDQLLLYCNHSNVRAVAVAGEVRLRDGQAAGVDWEELAEGARLAAGRLWSQDPQETSKD